MKIQLESGKMQRAKKILMYGVEGIGKSTWAAKFPRPLFFDTEGSTAHLDVQRVRFPNATLSQTDASFSQWQYLLQGLTEMKQPEYKGVFDTIVIDTADWAEMMCEAYILSREKVNSIERIGYGKGYVMVKEEFAKMLSLLYDLNYDLGYNIVILAHSIIRKVEKPDQDGAYDHYEPKILGKAGNAIAAMLKEWADCVFFAKFDDFVVTDRNGKTKVRNGDRVLFTQHSATFDAKNRFDMPAKLPLSFDAVNQYLQIARADGTTQKGNAEPLPQAAPTQKTITVSTEQKYAHLLKPCCVNKSLANIPIELLELVDKSPSHITLDEVWDILWWQDMTKQITPERKFPLSHVTPDFLREMCVEQWNEIENLVDDYRKKVGTEFPPLDDGVPF